MRILRVVLQTMIIALGSTAVVALGVGRQNWLAALGVAAFACFLFLLTLLLREHTETRRTPGRAFNQQILAVFLAFPGLAMCWQAALLVVGNQGPKTRHPWVLELYIKIFGPYAGALVLLAMGLQVLWLSYRVFRSEKPGKTWR